MNIDNLNNMEIQVSNFGPIREANISMRPFTVISGPNGSGKSFLTKMFYSFFKSISINHLTEAVLRQQGSLRVIEQSLARTMPDNSEYAYRIKEILVSADIATNEVVKMISESAGYSMDMELFRALYNLMDQYEEKLNIYLDEMLQFEMNHNVSDAEQKYIATLEVYSDLAKKHMSDMKSLLIEPESESNELLAQYFINEVLENFQISSIIPLMTKSTEEHQAIVNFNGLGMLTMRSMLDSQEINVELIGKKVRDFRKLNQVVYIESPVYWKLRKALSTQSINSVIDQKKHGRDNQLSGVPKHFVDLSNSIDIDVKRTKNSLADIADKIHKNIKGKIGINDQGEISFYADKYAGDREKNGISITLTASGVINLGIINLLIEREIITENSYLFIDEPEVNLHPAWQRVLIEALFDLSVAGVKVIITTHSIDIMKCVELLLVQNKEISDTHFGINQLSDDGRSINEDKSNIHKISTIQMDLGKSFDDMFIDIGLS